MLSLCYRKGSGRRGRGGASSRRDKGPSSDVQEVDNSPATSGASLKDQAAELLANQFLTVPSAGDGPSTSGQIQTQFVSQLSCLYLLSFYLSPLSLSFSLSLCHYNLLLVYIYMYSFYACTSALAYPHKCLFVAYTTVYMYVCPSVLLLYLHVHCTVTC